MEHEHIYKPTGGTGPQLSVTPDSAGWTFLSFSTVKLAAGETHGSELADQETAIVPLSGAGTVRAGGETYALARESVFTEMPEVVYLPPGVAVEVGTDGAFEFAIGSAPAEGLYPQRLWTPGEMKTEMRGGGASYRQISHILAPPIAAERLILYEVYVPRGTWSGWAPHCHDGFDGSPYLEETYYFRFDPPTSAFAMHRNWRIDEPFDETLVCGDGETAIVTKGFHSSVACPSSNMYFLNYLAGDLIGEDRSTPPCFHADHTWIDGAWSNGDEGAWTLPVVSQ